MWKKVLPGQKTVSSLKGAELDAVLRYKSVKLKPGETKVAQKKAAIASAKMALQQPSRPNAKATTKLEQAKQNEAQAAMAMFKGFK